MYITYYQYQYTLHVYRTLCGQITNGTDYARITAVPDGTECEWIATAQNGWHAVKIGSQIGWVSGKYSEITTT